MIVLYSGRGFPKISSLAGNSYRFFIRTSWQWQPNLDSHGDANPPITLQGDGTYREQPDLEWHWWVQEEDDRHDVQYSDQIIEEPPAPPVDDSETRLVQVEDFLDEEVQPQEVAQQFIEDSMDGVFGLLAEAWQAEDSDDDFLGLIDQLIEDVAAAPDDSETRLFFAEEAEVIDDTEWVQAFVDQIIEDAAVAPDDSEVRQFYSEEAAYIDEIDWIQPLVDQIIEEVAQPLAPDFPITGGYDPYLLDRPAARRKQREGKARRKSVREAYVEIFESQWPVDFRGRASLLVSGYARPDSDEKIIPPEAIDWASLRDDRLAVQALMSLWQGWLIQIDDEEILALLT